MSGCMVCSLLLGVCVTMCCAGGGGGGGGGEGVVGSTPSFPACCVLANHVMT